MYDPKKISHIVRVFEKLKKVPTQDATPKPAGILAHLKNLSASPAAPQPTTVSSPVLPSSSTSPTTNAEVPITLIFHNYILGSPRCY